MKDVERLQSETGNFLKDKLVPKTAYVDLQLFSLFKKFSAIHINVVTKFLIAAEQSSAPLSSLDGVGV